MIKKGCDISLPLGGFVCIVYLAEGFRLLFQDVLVTLSSLKVHTSYLPTSLKPGKKYSFNFCGEVFYPAEKPTVVCVWPVVL